MLRIRAKTVEDHEKQTVCFVIGILDGLERNLRRFFFWLVMAHEVNEKNIYDIRPILHYSLVQHDAHPVLCLYSIFL